MITSPGNTETFAEVKGVGDKKLDDYGEEFVAFIADYCAEENLSTDVLE